MNRFKVKVISVQKRQHFWDCQMKCAIILVGFQSCDAGTQPTFFMMKKYCRFVIKGFKKIEQVYPDWQRAQARAETALKEPTSEMIIVSGNKHLLGGMTR